MKRFAEFVGGSDDRLRVLARSSLVCCAGSAELESSFPGELTWRDAGQWVSAERNRELMRSALAQLSAVGHVDDVRAGLLEGGSCAAIHCRVDSQPHEIVFASAPWRRRTQRAPRLTSHDDGRCGVCVSPVSDL